MSHARPPNRNRASILSCRPPARHRGSHPRKRGPCSAPRRATRHALLNGHAPMDAVFFGWIVAGRLVVRATIVPDDDIALAPLVAVRGVRLDHVASKPPDQRVARLFRQTFDTQDFAGIEV